MAFRSPENVQRNELIRFQLQDNIRAPANGQEQLKKTYKFVVTDRSSFYDWYNAFFEVQFKLDLKANGGDIADAATTIINGSHSLIKRECPRRPREITKMWHMLGKLISVIFR